MRIKKYMEYIKESSGYQFGCVMLQVPFDNWKEITSMISPEDVYDPGDDKHGITEDPHLTLLYGLDPSIKEEDVRYILSGFKKPIDLEILGIDTFDNEEFDVVKFNVSVSPELQSIHDKLSTLPNSDKYPIYKPHITISYVKKGTGQKYSNPDYKLKVNGLNKICFSHPTDGKSYFNL